MNVLLKELMLEMFLVHYRRMPDSQSSDLLKTSTLLPHHPIVFSVLSLLPSLL